MLYVELGKRFSGFSPSTLWQHHYRSAGFVDTEAVCCSYGNAVDIAEWRLRGDLDDRQTGYCDSCGPILDGRSVAEVSLRAAEQMVAGEVHDMEIEAFNPLGWPVPVCCTAMLPAFIPNDDEIPHDIVGPVLLAPHSRQRLTLRLRVVLECLPGIHYLCVLQMVGADPTFVRLPVMVQPA